MSHTSKKRLEIFRQHMAKAYWAKRLALPLRERLAEEAVELVGAWMENYDSRARPYLAALLYDYFYLLGEANE